jgi:homoserine dehydrogenase
MRPVNLVLMGFGHVGKAFARLILEKGELCRERYGIDLRLKSFFRSKGGRFSGHRPDLADIVEAMAAGAPDHPPWNMNLNLDEVLSELEPGVLVECTPTNLTTGEPALGHIREALGKKWHIGAASKGALVLHFKELMDQAKTNGVQIKFSGATAAALPTLDVGTISLAGAEILGIEGILTGVTNLILTRMEEGIPFQEALKEAQARGIAEPDPSLDVDGWDSACKILLISNAVAGTDFVLSDVVREGIRGVKTEDIQSAKQEGRVLKLLGRLVREGGKSRAEVRLTAIGKDHPLFHISATNKAITYFTDTMGPVTVSGGKSDPRGTAAALLKDIINIYR